MNFVAVLDYEHLDNGMFLTSFAKALSKKKEQGIIIHGDSEYTERIIQTGVMRGAATVRAIKDLNHRLVALFADEGIAAIALNGYQKSLVKLAGGKIEIDKQQLENLPGSVMILLSNLVLNETGSIKPINLPDLSLAIKKAFDIDAITLFSINDSADLMVKDFPQSVKINEKEKKFIESHIPKSFRDTSLEVNLCTPSSF